MSKIFSLLEVTLAVCFLLLGFTLNTLLTNYYDKDKVEYYVTESLNENQETTTTNNDNVEQEKAQVTNVFPSQQCKDISLGEFERRKIIHSTGSMRPYIFSGDIVLKTSYDEEKELVVGDVVATSEIIHRVSSIKYCDWNTTPNKTCVDWFSMKGDNNARSDAKRYKTSDINYVVCGVLRGVNA